MKPTSWSFLLFPLFFAFAACSSETENQTNAPAKAKPSIHKTASIAKVSVEDFAKKLALNKDAQLIDVRTPQEFDQGHLDNAVNINYHGDLFIEELRKLDKNKTLFIYCQSGGRSGKTCHKLKKMGFREVYDLQGGYLAWKEKQ